MLELSYRDGKLMLHFAAAIDGRGDNSGPHDAVDLLKGLLNALYSRDREDLLGRSSHARRYDRSVREFTFNIICLSPSTYRQLANFVPMPTERHAR